MRFRIVVFLLLIHVISACNPGGDARQTIYIFCAASLRPVMEEIKKNWELENESRVMINAASTGTLARQIENGAPADIFVSANEEWMEYLERSNLLTCAPVLLAANRLVIAGHSDSLLDTISVTTFATLASNNSGRITMADPGHVPLGRYAQAALQHYKVFEDVRKNCIMGKDARNTLRILELKEADFGILYYSDAISSKKVKILSIIPSNTHPPIRYSAATLADPNPSSIKFLKYLGQYRGSVWQDLGFELKNGQVPARL